MSDKVIVSKLPTNSGPIVKNPTKAVVGEVIAVGEKLIVVRDAKGGIAEVDLDKNAPEFRTKDLVTFSEHGVLTDHRREQVKKKAATAPESKKQGSARCPVNA